MTETVHLSELNVPRRAADAHKGTFGRALVIGGSPGMSGAICLAATAALRGGAGLVTAAVPASIRSIVAGFEPSYMTIALPCCPAGQLVDQPLNSIREYLAGRSAVAIGPGLGQSNAAADLVLSVMKESPCPVVLDADALNLAADFNMLNRPELVRQCVITPHPGEFGRLTGMPAARINQERTKLASDFARDHGLVVVLKGAGTIVTDGQRVFVNSTGNPGMASGGCGDVLTGLIAALLAQGKQPFAAAALGVHLHGLAGDIAAQEMSQPGMIASDLLCCIGKAWLHFQANPAL